MSLAIEIAERGLAPDPLVRAGIRALLRGRLADEKKRAGEPLEKRMKSGPIAVATAEANDQHYELPPRFFELSLGSHLKYSSCYWGDEVTSLDVAEAAMLGLTCERAELADGQDVLELGCGWGSLTLWMAQRYPASRILAVSNSADQRRFIEARCAERALGNVEVVTADMNDFTPERTFDRVVSIEMFEHMRNYQELLRRISTWLNPEGCLFIHIFCHRSLAYFFETDGENDWMARHFFTGGLMPSFDLLQRFDQHLAVEESWAVSGLHYQRTAEAWLANLDARRREVEGLFRETYGAAQAARWVRRWRLFFLACAELFGYRGGEEWLVGHYRLRRVGRESAAIKEAT